MPIFGSNTQHQTNTDGRKSDNKNAADFRSTEESAQKAGNDSSNHGSVYANTTGGHGIIELTEHKTQTVSKQDHTKIDGRLTAPTDTVVKPEQILGSQTDSASSKVRQVQELGVLNISNNSAPVVVITNGNIHGGHAAEQRSDSSFRKEQSLSQQVDTDVEPTLENHVSPTVSNNQDFQGTQEGAKAYSTGAAGGSCSQSDLQKTSGSSKDRLNGSSKVQDGRNVFSQSGSQAGSNKDEQTLDVAAGQGVTKSGGSGNKGDQSATQPAAKPNSKGVLGSLSGGIFNKGNQSATQPAAKPNSNNQPAAKPNSKGVLGSL